MSSPKSAKTFSEITSLPRRFSEITALSCAIPIPASSLGRCVVFVLRRTDLMMMKLWNWYNNCLSVHPVKTQVISSGVLWAVGDIAAQYITHSATKNRLRLSDADTKFMIDWRRVAITSGFGLGFVGPVGHFWYEGMDKFITTKLQLRPKSVRFVAAKVAMDGFIFGPIHLFVFFTYMGLSAGKTMPQVKEDLKKNFIPAFLLEGGVWPIVQVVNFRYVPVKYQLLYVNLFCLMDSIFLSWLEQQKDAPWKQRFMSFGPFKEKEKGDQHS